MIVFEHVNQKIVPNNVDRISLEHQSRIMHQMAFRSE